MSATEHPCAQPRVPVSPRLFEALFRHSRDAIALVSAEGIVQYTSPASTHLLGCTPDELLAQPHVFAYLHPDDQPRAVAAFAALLAQPGASIAEMVRCRHKDGHWVWLEVTGTNLIHDPEVGAIVANFRDATGRVQQEAERAVQARLEGALVVARTAAHEILNALQPVGGFAELLSAAPAVRADPRLAAYAKEIQRAVLEVGERVGRLQQIVRLAEDTTVLGPQHPMVDLERSTAA